MTVSYDREVAVVGGGVAGPAAAVFTARGCLDTVVFDRGPASIEQCAHLGNYLGFPGGVGTGTFRELTRAHLETVGCALREHRVQTVRRLDPGGGFEIETENDGITARRVVAATNSEAAYLDPLDEAGLRSRNDTGVNPNAVDEEGRTEVDGLYVAGPLAGVPDQALIAAGHGARVGRALVRDALRDRGYWPEAAARYYDWRTRETAHEEGWEEAYAARLRETAPEDADKVRVERVVDELVARERRHALAAAEIRRRNRRGQRMVLDQFDESVLRDYLAEK